MVDVCNIVRMGSENERLKNGFLHWQCRLRQIAMRNDGGMPSPGMKPALVLAGGSEPITEIVTVLNRRPEFSQTMELRHIARRTQDPAQRREDALKFFSERYYQASKEFSDVLTATFVPNSKLAARLVSDRRCTLRFEQFNQTYELPCAVRRLSDNNPLRDATFWHNLLFNPGLARDAGILGFEPNWAAAKAPGK